MLEAGQLPALGRLRAAGGYARVATTYPAQTPVAWSSFATGVNPGGHGVYDFLRRDPATYLPDLALNRYEQKNPFIPPKAVNLRRGTPLWELLANAGVPATVLRCPCTYPPDRVEGRLLAGLGVPDLRGGLGTPTFYTTEAGIAAGESERVVRGTLEGNRVGTRLTGPRLPRGGDATVDLVIEVDSGGGRALVRAGGDPVEVRENGWSAWLKVKFKLGLMQSVAGAVRFFLPRTSGGFALYASPVNFTADAPPFPISAPRGYAGELAKRIGTYYTAGMVEDHTGLINGRIDEAAFLAQCEGVMREREAMLDLELARVKEGFLFCLFDTPDRIQHMFWRFREPDHPANRGPDGAPAHPAAIEASRPPIEEHYRRCDAVVARVLDAADEKALVVVLSDHGFTSFRRGVHLNNWLHAQGLLALRAGARPGFEAGELFREVDWSRTRAYALGLGGIYLNRRGREGQGILSADEAAETARAIREGLTGMMDAARAATAVRGVKLREEIYRGPYAEEAPDLLVLFAEGYRASWTTGLGGVGEGLFEHNTRRWGGDHIVDPALVPGVLFMSRRFDTRSPGFLDLAPTILAALGVPRGAAMEGSDLLA